STTVTISDRGPFTGGRILDLSPRSAREIGMHGGLAQVEIRPASAR
ncbi:MAG: septal ring lytic transglycosylase RlpA family protein, partial [Roseomonas sp.]|nr:septal ring lytic transglycosylase RlpA family protein [Roseomonas sp.]